MSSRWPDKVIPKFTDAELNDAINQHQHDPDPVTQSIVRGCWREWERRHGLNHLDDE